MPDFKACYPHLIQALSTEVPRLLRECELRNLLTRKQVAAVRSGGGDLQKVVILLDIVSSKTNFLPHFLSLLDDMGLVTSANVVRRQMGLKERPTQPQAVNNTKPVRRNEQTIDKLTLNREQTSQSFRGEKMSRMSRMRQLANKALVRIEALAPENVQTASAENLGGFIRPRRKLSSPMLFRIISWSMVVSSLASIGCGIACLVSSQNEVLEFIVIATCSDGSAIWAGSFGFLCAILNLLLLRNHQNISGSSMKSVAFSSSFTTITSVASGPCQIFWILKSENEGVKASCEVGLVSALLMLIISLISTRWMRRIEQEYHRAKKAALEKLYDMAGGQEALMKQMKEAMEKASLEQQSKPVSPEQQINEAKSRAEMSKRFMKCYPILIETLSLNIGLNLSLFRMKNLITEIEHKLLKDLKGSSTDRTVKMLDKVGEKPNFLNPLVELLKEKSMGTVAHEVLKLMETPASDQEYEKSSHNATQLQAFNNCQGILVDALRPRILITVVPNARGKGLIDINEAESIKRRGETEEAVFMFLSMIKHKENFVERLYQVLEECDLKNIVTLVKQKMEKQIDNITGRIPVGRDSAAPKLNLLDSSAIEEKTRVIKAFKQTYSFLTDIMAGTNLNSLLDKFCVKNLLNENQVAHLRSMPAGRDQVTVFLDIIVGKDNFSATFLQVLDENGQVETANIVRRALGLKEKPTYKDDQNTESVSEEADPREAQIREMFEKENKAEMNKQSKEHEKWLKKAHKAKAAKDLEIQEKFKVIQPQIVDRLTTHIHEVIIRMFAMSVITSDEKARLEMMDHPSGKAIQLLDYSNYRSNYIPSLLKILDEMNLGAVSDFIRLEIGMPVSAKGLLAEKDLTKSVPEKHFERCYPLMVEVFHHKVKTVLLPNLKKYGLIEEDEEAKLLQVENDRRIVVESLITIRGKTDFYFILEKILKNLGLNAALKNMYNLLHKGIDEGQRKENSFELMKNFPEICPLIPEVFADEAQMLVILPKLFRCGLLTRTEVSAIETVPMEKMCRVKVMLELCKMKDKFIAPLLKVLELCQTPYSAHILRIAVGFVTHSFPDIQSLLESDWVMKSSKIADKREAKMLRDYSQARRISETAKNKAVSKTELIFRQSQTWLVQEIQPKIDEIIRNLTMRQIIDGYNKQLIRTMKLPEAKAIRLLDTFPVAYIQELLDVLEIVGLNNTSIELAAKLGLSSQAVQLQRQTFSLFYPELIERLRDRIELVIAECYKLHLLTRSEIEDLNETTQRGPTSQTVKLLDAISMKPKFLHLFTQALDNLKLNELSQQLQSAISSETVVVDKAPLLLCSEFLKEALVPVIFNVISEAELFGLIEKDAGKNAALRRLKPSEAIDMFLDEIRSKEDHAKKLVLILEKMGRTETVREMQSIWKAGGPLLIKPTLKSALKFRSKRPKDFQKVLKAFYTGYPLLTECLAGQLDSRLRQFFSIGLISSAEKTELRQRPDSQAKIASFLNLISQKKWFLAPFLRVLDKTHLLYLANFTRRTVGLNPNAEGQSDGVDRREAEMLDLYLNDYRSKRPKKTVSSIVSI